MRRAFYSAVTMIGFWLPLTVAAQPTYTATLLDISSIDSNGHAINNSGYSVGYFRDPATNEARAYTAQGTTVTLLPGFGLGGPYMKTIDVNNSGISTGRSLTPGYAFHAFTYDGNTNALIDIGTLGGTNSYGEAINDHGQVVGFSDIVGGGSHAFSYANGVMTDIGTLGGAQSVAYDVNNHGTIVGESDVSGGGKRGYIYENGLMTTLGTLGGSRSSAVAINDAGLIAANSTTTNGQQHAAVIDGGIMLDLGTLGGATSEAFDINEGGYIVGTSLNASGQSRGFIWHESFGMLDVNDLFIATDDNLLWVTIIWGINDQGQLVGAASNAAGYGQAVYLDLMTSEVPLPAAAWLFLSAIGSLTLKARKARQ